MNRIEKHGTVNKMFSFVTNVLFFLCRLQYDIVCGVSSDGKVAKMNGEIQNVPITTLAGIASLTDCKSNDFISILLLTILAFNFVCTLAKVYVLCSHNVLHEFITVA